MNRSFYLRRRFILMVTVFAVWCSPVVQAADDKPSSDSSEDLFNALEKSAEGTFTDRESSLSAQWDRMEAAEEQKWKKLEQDVMQKWDSYRPTTKKTWVDYDGNREAVSQVNFDTGEVVVEALVPKDATPEQQRSAIAKKIDSLEKAKDAAGQPVMTDLLPKGTEKEVVTATAPTEVPTIVKGQDGVERLKVGVSLSMVPDHIARQARKFLPAVDAAAKVNGIDEALVLAIIHTESAFNPMARSPVPAYGLMQIVPRYAGKEAYMQLYGKEKVLTADYLYKPNNNILLGSTYLERLFTTYFNDVGDVAKQRYIVICAYNWGPTAMRDRVLAKLDYNTLNAEQVRQYLLAHVPEETRNYLKRVEERREKYAKGL